MKFDKFPSRFEQEKKELLEQKEYEIERDLSDKERKIKQKYEKKDTPNPFEILSKCCDFVFGDYAFLVDVFLIIFFPIGIIVLLIASIVSLVLWIINSPYNKSLPGKIDAEIKKANDIANKMLSHYKESTLKEIEDYKNSFEDEKNKLIIDYAASSKVDEVAKWFAKKFLKRIESADRSTHRENVIVNFNLTIYEDGIVYDGYEPWDQRYYDFDKHRCETMPELTSRAALATAIASQIKTNTMMQYEKDASGTEYDIDINFSDGYDLKSQLVYTAPNGNFKPVQQW